MYRFAAAALGALNLGGAVYLQRLLAGPQLTGVTLPGFFGFVQARTAAGSIYIAPDADESVRNAYM